MLNKLFLTIFMIQFNTCIISQSYNSYKKPTKEESTSISFGLGLAKAYPLKNDLFGNTNYRFLISGSVDLKVAPPFFINIGADIHKSELIGYSTTLNINVMPTIKINFLNNKITLNLGAGGTSSFFFQNEGGIILGLLFSVKPQYNINKKLSVGLEIKHPNYFGEEYTNYFLIRSNLFIAVKL